MVRRGEIYWVNFGQSRGREQSGLRPALVIQSDAGNESSETTIVAQMTSRSFVRDYPMHVEIPAGDAGLDQRSTVLLEQIQTVDVSRLKRRAGALAPDVMHDVDRALRHVLALF